MKKSLLVLVALLQWACSQPAKSPSSTAADAAAAGRAQRVTIVRDDWGIAHVSGESDADAVFGVMYAQAEDDFNRVETNLINAMGRLAEAEGEKEIFRDLRMKLFIQPDDLKSHYAAAPDSLKRLMDGWAEGLNYYLATHPNVKPRVITHFEPWMALSFTEGSIGGDIERISLTELEGFYGNAPRVPQAAALDVGPPEPTGSNGFAIAPANSASGKALLWINPHTSFFFRAEAQMTSREGLNAYGALTWGQFFVYQGFNDKAGWMHTSSSGVDNIDEYLETVERSGEAVLYRFGSEKRPVDVRKISVPYKTASGMATREFTVYRTHHGPIVRQIGDRWVSVRLLQDPVKALTQSYMRTKATNYRSFRDTMELHTNTSNNTVFADAEGNIAFFYSNFVPRRDPAFDYTKPVDGSNPATDWKGTLSIDESPNVLNPPNGWIQNTNNWPFSVAGPNSPKASDYPKYMEVGTENPRGVHAIRVLDGKKGFTIDSLIAAAFDTALPEFDLLVPTLVKAYDGLKQTDPLRAKLSEPIAQLRGWDRRWSVSSVPTTLAVFWGEELWTKVAPEARKANLTVYEYMEARATAAQRLEALATIVDKLTADFGTWKLPWGDINRFQRISPEIVHPFDDSQPSIPVGFTSSRWGSLAAFGARSFNGTKKIYGTTGNSFLAAVEFGDRVRAKAVSAGGESGHPDSKHFNDQAQRYADGNLRDVYFYPEDLAAHTERTYHPGE
ncbi:MAG: penicillin acylase family protein [Acidobacteria bacterium]|nr:penicillin acylase family protein [Acidobacteriota bacterium]